MEKINCIIKVRQNKKTKQKLATIPKKINIQPGDYIKITKVKL